MGALPCRPGAAVEEIVLAEGMTPAEFIAKWRAVTLNERAVAQSHFNDLCALLGEDTPIEADPEGEWYCFEKGARKDSGGDGWADVWKRERFAWEYKSQGKDLDAAFQQLRQYALALENPPLLIVSDMRRFRIHTNFTNSVSQVHEFTLHDLDDSDTWNKLKWAFSDPERLRPGQTRQTVTEQAAAKFADLAQELRDARPRPTGRRAVRDSAGVLHVCRGHEAAARRTVSPHVGADPPPTRHASKRRPPPCSPPCRPAANSAWTMSPGSTADSSTTTAPPCRWTDAASNWCATQPGWTGRKWTRPSWARCSSAGWTRTSAPSWARITPTPTRSCASSSR